MSTTRIRRDQVKPGMVVHSSHGYRLLINDVIDNAIVRTDDRHVEFRGHIVQADGTPSAVFRNERYPAGSIVEVELKGVSVSIALSTLLGKLEEQGTIQCLSGDGGVWDEALEMLRQQYGDVMEVEVR